MNNYLFNLSIVKQFEWIYVIISVLFWPVKTIIITVQTIHSKLKITQIQNIKRYVYVI